MRAYVSLEAQRGRRDLRLLPPDEGRWVDSDALADAPEPAILCGDWVSSADAPTVLRRRQENQATTVLVPGFSAGGIGKILGATNEITITPVETQLVTWKDGSTLEIPATTALETTLPEGQWGRSDGHLTVLAWRLHTQSGWTILCMPTVAGRALGASPDQQLALLDRILGEAERLTPAREAVPDQVAAASARDYLDQHGELGALALLAWWAAPGPVLDADALRRLGVHLPEAELERLGQALPPVEPGEVEATLRQAGWGAHLRILKQRPREEP